MSLDQLKKDIKDTAEEMSSLENVFGQFTKMISDLSGALNQLSQVQATVGQTASKVSTLSRTRAKIRARRLNQLRQQRVSESSGISGTVTLEDEEKASTEQTTLLGKVLYGEGGYKFFRNVLSGAGLFNFIASGRVFFDVYSKINSGFKKLFGGDLKDKILGDFPSKLKSIGTSANKLGKFFGPGRGKLARQFGYTFVKLFMAISKIGLVITGALLLFMILKKAFGNINFDTVFDFVMKIGEGISGFFSYIGGLFAPFFGEGGLISQLATSIIALFNGEGNFFFKLGDVLLVAVQFLGKFVKSVFLLTYEILIGLPARLLGGIAKVVGNVFNWLISLPSILITDLREVIARLFRMDGPLRAIFEAPFDMISGIFDVAKSVGSFITDTFTSVVTLIGDVAKNPGDALKNFKVDLLIGAVKAFEPLRIAIMKIVTKASKEEEKAEQIRQDTADLIAALEDSRATIPTAATGGLRSGMTLVGEQGPELVRLPTGSRVFSNNQTRGMMGGGNTNNITINVQGGLGSDAEMRKLAQRLGRMVNLEINRTTSSRTSRV